MKRIVIGSAAIALAAVPAAVGLWGNASFSQAVPVRVPASAQVVTVTAPASVDDHGGDRPRDQRTEPGDDRDSSGRGSSNSGPGSDDSGRHGGDDDDSRHGGSGSRHGGDDDGSGHDAGDDHGSGGHGSDDD